MPSQAIIFYQPRSACRVMMRMALDQQDNIDVAAHYFSSPRGAQVGWLMSKDYENGMNESARQSFNEAVQKDVEAWQTRLKESQEQNRLLLLQTYPFGPVSPDRVLEYIHIIESQISSTKVKAENVTMIPDSLLLTPGTLPIFVIRNPTLVVPSAFRVLKNMGISQGGGRPMALMTTNVIWHRALYDFYISHNIQPVVLDADDYLTSEDYVRKTCTRLGLDPSKAQFSWPALSEEQKSKMHPMEFLSAEELFKSTGPDAQRAGRNMSPDLGQSKWEEEFGEDKELIGQLVGYCMPHYEYLRERRMQ